MSKSSKKPPPSQSDSSQNNQPSAKPKPYAEVITDQAESSTGLFTVHRLNGKTYYEIPLTLLQRDMLWYTEIAQTPVGVGYSGQGVDFRIVRWQRQQNKLFLRAVSYRKRGDGEAALQQAIEAVSLAPIIISFDIEAERKKRNKTEALVIEVTTLLTSDLAEFSALRLLSSLRLPSSPKVDDARSYIQQIKTFPRNIEVRSTITYDLGPPPLPKPDARLRPATIPEGVRSLSVLVHYSMTLLPEQPMQGRYFDPRVGYFAVSFEDYAGDENRVVERRYITRYRLEKKRPQAAVSKPVEPIVFYLSREVPQIWRPYIKQGIEDWNQAFKSAGFNQAIVARDAPDTTEDPDWDPEDSRYSVIRWSALPVANAMGPHVHDPRSGEIISSHIIIWHDVLKLAQAWYFAMCSALDDNARQLPLSPQLMGQLLRYIVAHEVGHGLGLRHNHKASTGFSIAQLRDPAFTAQYGTVASIMSYGRFNYVAQPGDGVEQLIPKIAPYDHFAIEWGYKPLPDHSPHDEKPLLDTLAARQIDEPWLRFGGEDGPATVDPSVLTENIGDDAIAATANGLANLERVMDWLVPATTRLGEDHRLLQETYEQLFRLRQHWLGAVVKLVGGVVETRYLGGRGDDSFSRVPRERQSEAVRFLLQHAFIPPYALLQPAVLNRFRHIHVADLLLDQQKALLELLLSERRIRLLSDAEMLSPDDCYTALQLLSDVQAGLWQELETAQPRIDSYRRQLQRVYLQHADGVINSDFGWQSDFRAIARGLLQELAQRIELNLAKVQERMTALHLRDCGGQIERILTPFKG
jgi:hypothetical protein